VAESVPAQQELVHVLVGIALGRMIQRQ